MNQPLFLPMSRAEMQALGWKEIDVLIVTGDAYVDHPGFGAAVIGRWLVSRGWRTGIIAQPDWKAPGSVTAMGRPRLFAGVTAGAMDSMVANYTANKKLRRDDAYAPGGCYGLRPNRASIIYTSLVKHAFPGLPVVLGGIEASLRRLAHYDYWEDRVRRSLLLDAKADILVYGMGERAVAEIATRLDKQEPLDNIAGTAVVRPAIPSGPTIKLLPAYEEILADKINLAKAGIEDEAARNAPLGKILAQAYGARYVIVHAPARPLTTEEMDVVYSLPFTRRSHPSYPEPVPALEPVANSIVTHRGCFGGCSFCGLGAHQGKHIQSRSLNSIISEIRHLTGLKTFHGTITDLGGPSANMYGLECRRPAGPCSRPACLFPTVCPHLATDHGAQIELWRRASSIPGVKHVFVASGIRFDLALRDPRYLAALLQGRHVSGVLKIAPEHISEDILTLMRKPKPEVLEKFIRAFVAENHKLDRPAQLAAYFISAFPGSTRDSMQAVAAFAREHGLRVEQMQDFIPLPMTLAGIIYYTGSNPWTGKALQLDKSWKERKTQRQALLGRNGRKLNRGGLSTTPRPSRHSRDGEHP